ncbi:MAG: hypothetical protein KAJ93_01240 [Methanosarcinales archaeon]|nr:hypothetical protein [Methanosarcinales archaeon]
MDYIKIRKQIQSGGEDLYHRLGKTSRNLQYLAGEIMAGNEEYIKRLTIEQEQFNIKADDMILNGFSVNQKTYLIEIEKELIFYKQKLDEMNNFIDMNVEELE